MTLKLTALNNWIHFIEHPTRFERSSRLSPMGGQRFKGILFCFHSGLSSSLAGGMR